ncbi:MAG: helicase-related protein, partial [Thermodesulfovibrio sp.]
MIYNGGMNLDLTFIVNEDGKSLKDRFEQLIKDCKFFDCLVAYFYVSGFHLIYNALKNTEKLRILVGIGISKESYNLVKKAEQEKSSQYETKQEIEKLIEEEMAESEDSENVESGVQKFIEWINTGKIEIRAYPSQN